MNQMYHVLTELLIEKSNITLGEVRNLKYSLGYILKKNTLLELENQKKTSQFIEDCKILFESLECLEKKIRQNIIDMKKVKKSFNKTLVKSNSHLTNMLLLDCFQSREFSFSEKLEYLHRSYENLISPYQTLYLPLPTSYRRVRTSNLMLYFNKSLNKKLKLLQNKFFSIKPQNNDYKTFSTWNFSEYDHVKNIDETNNILLSLSFWFYEKQLFYPIAYHEIAHPLYYDSNGVIQLDKNDKIYIKNYIDNESSLQMEENKYNRDQLLIQNIYQDIIADFCAFSLSGDSYIFTLFFHGFVQGLYRNFYQDLEIKNLGKKISDDERRCLNREKDLTLLDWSFQENGQNFMSYFIRLKLLIELSKKLTLKNKTYTIFKSQIEEILEILDYIYPANKKNNINSFEDILQSFYKENRQYKYWKNYTLLLINLYKEIVFDRKKIHSKVSEVLFEIKKDFNNNIVFHEILKNNNIMNSSDISSMNSSFDVYWKQTFRNENKEKYLGRLLRLYNLSELGVEPEKNDIRDIIYELVFYKFSSKQNPYLMFYGRRGTNMVNMHNLKYAFGPYDFAEISQKTTLKKDKELDRDFKRENKKDTNENNLFFTERHALLLLLEHKGEVTQRNNLFDACISIDIQQELDNDSTKKFFVALKKHLNTFSKKCKNKFELVQFFVSLGNENFLLYVKNIDMGVFEEVINRISEVEYIKNLHTTILLNENLNKNNDFYTSDQREIIVLGKLKVDSAFYTIKKIIEEKHNNVNIYRKYGVFDFIITFSLNNEEIKIFELINEILKDINEYIFDIQLEYQSSN